MHPSEFPSADRGPTPILDDSLGRDLGNLLLTLTLLWAYVAFSQYLITWLGQLPDEIRFFVPRTEGHWRLLAWWLVASSFVIPFLSLLFRRVKDSPLLLRGICMIVLLGRILDQYWLVSP